MADPAQPSAIFDTAERQASESEARLVRDVRWRLVAWSGGSTLLVLLVLGIALYVSVASSLQASSLAVLDDRAQDIVSFIRGERPQPGGGGFNFSFGGGTFAIVATPSGQAIGPNQFDVPAGLPDADAIAAADASGRDVRNRTINFPQPGPGAGSIKVVSVPVRQLTLPVDTSFGSYHVQVVQDRSTEARTLETSSSSSRSAASWSFWWPWASGRSTPGARSCPFANHWARSAPHSGASVSSQRTPAMSFGRRSR